ncbi:MAG: hypothetical protein QUS13_12235 [Smithella sp.]|nr:hypothetical protein [Smithella sp.]
MESGLQEIRREKVFITPDMNIKDIMEKYGVAETTARNSQRKGWLIKNYSRNQVIIDRSNFDPKLCYSIAKQVFWKRLRNNPVALEIRDDLLQEAVTLMYMQSGKIKEGANEKYNCRYGYWWCAYNAMMVYLKKWINRTEPECELQNDYHPMMAHSNRVWIPDHGWQYC